MHFHSRLGLQARALPQLPSRTSLLPSLRPTSRCFSIQPRSSSTCTSDPTVLSAPTGTCYKHHFPSLCHNFRRNSSSTRRKIALPNDETTLLTAIQKGEDPLYLLRRYFIQDELTKNLATVCLEGFLGQLEAIPSAEAVARKVQKEKVGQLVLQWLWDDYKNIRNPEDRRLVNATADLLIQEGQEEMAWEWMFLPVNIKLSEGMSTKDINMQVTWRGNMASSLTRAKAKDIRGSLDDTAEVLFRGWNFSRKGGNNRIPMAGITSFLERQMMNPIPLANGTPENGPSQHSSDYECRYPETDPMVWQRLYDSLPVLSFERVRGEMDQAQMMLFHPIQPDPWPSFRIIRSIDQDSDHSARRISKPSHRIAQAQRFRFCAILLEEQGFPEEAEYVRQATRRIWPRLSLRDVAEEVTMKPLQDPSTKRKIPRSPYPRWR